MKRPPTWTWCLIWTNSLGLRLVSIDAKRKSSWCPLIDEVLEAEDDEDTGSVAGSGSSPVLETQK